MSAASDSPNGWIVFVVAARLFFGVRAEFGGEADAFGERHRQDQRRALGPARQLDPAAHRGGALVQAADAEAARLGEVGAAEPDAVVADLQRQHAAGQRQVDADAGRVRVLGDVGERLLRRPVSHQGHARGQRHRVLAGAKAARDAGAALEAAAHPLQRRHQPLLQDRRMQVVHDALAGFDGVRDHLERRLRALAHLGILGVARDPGQIELQCGQGTADIIMDFACDGGTFHVDAGLQMLRQLGQPLARLGQLLVGRRPRQARLVGVDGVFDGGRQAREIGLEQVVAGAVAHRGDRDVLADLARDQDEGQRSLRRLGDVEGGQAREARDVEIGQDDVPVALERGAEGGLGVDPRRLDLRDGAAQVGHHQFVVEFGILQVQHPQAGSAGWRGVGRHGSEYRRPPAGWRWPKNGPWSRCRPT
jgi:hypothetical protein